MIYRQKNKRNISITIKISGETIDKTRSVTYLGIVMDDSLTWNSHIDKIISKLKPKVGILRRCSYLPVKAVKSVYAAHILSVLYNGLVSM